MKEELDSDGASQDEFEEAASPDEDMTSPKMPEYSHLPPDPQEPEDGDGDSEVMEDMDVALQEQMQEAMRREMEEGMRQEMTEDEMHQDIKKEIEDQEYYPEESQQEMQEEPQDEKPNDLQKVIIEQEIHLNIRQELTNEKEKNKDEKKGKIQVCETYDRITPRVNDLYLSALYDLLDHQEQDK
ncbi:Uncharacterized protein OBRU01_17720, partial [Operophtera brumata]